MPIMQNGAGAARKKGAPIGLGAFEHQDRGDRIAGKAGCDDAIDVDDDIFSSRGLGSRKHQIVP
jgi:hypothetical protein